MADTIPDGEGPEGLQPTKIRIRVKKDQFLKLKCITDIGLCEIHIKQ
jgi:hypothetical protein